MKNILIWVGIVALSLQDYFKKPVKPTRQQQFFQTGSTSQAFIEGVDERDYTSGKKKLTKLFGKPDIVAIRSSATWYLPNNVILTIIARKHPEFVVFIKSSEDDFQRRYLFNNIVYYDSILEKQVILGVFSFMQHLNYIGLEPEMPDEYIKLYEISQAGDWELAFQIAKGQGLL